jgi:hypothetical protein
MTCIVGIADKGEVFIGADSCASVDDDLFLIENGKVFEKGPFRFGCAGERRASEIVRYSFKMAELPCCEGKPTNEDLDCYMASKFADTLRLLFKDKGALCVREAVETFSATMLVGIHGRLYFVSGNFSVTPVLDGVWACGSGQDFALGSLRSTREYPIRRRIEMALEAAANYSDGVRPPFHILPSESVIQDASR